MPIALPLVGFAMFGVVVALLLKGKTTPVVALTLVPALAALVLGHSPLEINEFIKTGVAASANTAILLFFAIVFFGVMADVGVFDVVVGRLIRRAGNNVVKITIAAAFIPIMALDSATATSVLITVPAMLPVFRRAGIRPQVLLCLTASGMGVINLVPWSGAMARVATVLEKDAADLWHMLLPVQIASAFLVLGLGAFLGFVEKRRIAAEGGAAPVPETAVEAERQFAACDHRRSPKLLRFNIALTAGVIALMAANVMTGFVVFMLAACVALAVNFDSLKKQDKRIKAHAPAAFLIGATMLSAGSMVAILNGTGMLEAMAKTLISVIPEALGSHIHVLFGLVSVPLGLVVGTDAYFYGIVPLVVEVASRYGIAPLDTGLAMLVGKNFGVMLSPLVPATYLAIGLADVELKEHIRFSFKYLMAMSLLILSLSFAMGVIAW